MSECEIREASALDRFRSMMTEADSAGVRFVCGVCGFTTEDRAAAVMHERREAQG